MRLTRAKGPLPQLNTPGGDDEAVVLGLQRLGPGGEHARQLARLLVVARPLERLTAFFQLELVVFVGVADAVPLWTYVPAIILSIAGTTLAAQVLERMTDMGFRAWTRRVIFAVSAIYLARGVMLIWSGQY